MSSQKRWADRLLTFVFIVFIICPLVFADFEGGKLSEAENRLLAKAPDLLNPSAGGLRSDVENWINDNAGGRAFASGINSNLTWVLFGESAKTDTIVGKDDWLFYYTEAIGADFRHENLLSQENLDMFAKHVQLIGDYCLKKGASPLFVQIPDKKTVYADKYPGGIKQGEGSSRADTLYAQTLGKTNVPIVWLKDKLIESRSMGNVYSPRIDNAHWNTLGAYIGFEAICEALNRHYGNEIRYTPLADCKVESFENTGLFNGAVEISETDYRITSGSADGWVDDSAYLDRFGYLTYASDPGSWKVRRLNPASSNPTLLYVGDSYTQKMFDDLAETFSEMTFLHILDMQYLPEMLDELQPDYVVLEWVERQFDNQNYCMWQTASKIWSIENPQ